MVRYSLGIGAALAIVSSSARADSADPRQLFDKADTEMAAHDYDAACRDYHASYEAGHAPGALKGEAECEEARGRLATALNLWKKIATTDDAERKARALDAVAKLEPRVGGIRLTQEKCLPPAVVTLDGAAVSLDESHPLDAGVHKLVIDGNGETQTREVTITDGAYQTVSVPLLKPDQCSSGPQSKPPRLLIAGLATAGVSVASWIGFGITGGLVLSTHSDFAACLKSSCPDEASLHSKGTSLLIANGVFGGVAIATAIAAVPLIVVGAKSAKRDVAVSVFSDGTGGGLSAHGSF